MAWEKIGAKGVEKQQPELIAQLRHQRSLLVVLSNFSQQTEQLYHAHSYSLKAHISAFRGLDQPPHVLCHFLGVQKFKFSIGNDLRRLTVRDLVTEGRHCGVV